MGRSAWILLASPLGQANALAFALAQLPLERASKSQRSCPGGRRGPPKEAPPANDPKNQVVDIAAFLPGKDLSLAVAGSLTPSRPGGGGPGRHDGHTRGPGHTTSPRPQSAAQAVRPQAPGGGEDGERDTVSGHPAGMPLAGVQSPAHASPAHSLRVNP